MTDISHLLGRVHQGDNLAELKKMPDNSVHSVVCDPPYGLSFMGKHWDYDVPQVETWREVLRVLKPGGYLLCFGGSRTFHRIVVNIEDAGFEIRDTIFWCYGSGFPKSHDISKGIDKQAGVERERIKTPMGPTGNKYAKGLGDNRPWMQEAAEKGYHEHEGNKPVTEAARQWQGWGTALKPAVEPICMARKPISEDTIAANVIKWGTGGINIDGCRVETVDNLNGGAYSGGERKEGDWKDKSGFKNDKLDKFQQPPGRWPANIIHDGSEEVLAGFPNTQSTIHEGERGTGGIWGPSSGGPCGPTYGDSGSAARFFYTAKASKWDRNEDCEGLEEKQYSHDGRETPIENAYQRNKSVSKNHHPTVKPTDLMQYLCRLVTPPDGIVLDPYSGSGSTGKAALLECFRFIGFEREAEYCKIANARIAFVKGQLKLF